MTPSAPHLYIGLMSGTSMDSLDAALVDFSSPQPQLLGSEKKTIDTSLQQQLLKLCASFDPGGHTQEAALLANLDQHLAEQFSTIVLSLLQKTAVAKQRIRAIGSHGQTVFHRPPAPGTQGFSLQIGKPQQIAHLTGITTVGDFRNADMRAGGQGAPLVPAFHQAVFHHPEIHRVIVNIGGMANITVLPAAGVVKGFDTGPGNVLMDGWIQRHAKLPFDRAGRWAAAETTDHELLHQLLSEPYFAKTPPKSTGRELFNLSWLDAQLGKLHRSLNPAVVQATLASLTAASIADAIREQAPGTQEIFVCGGGAHNTHLINLLKKHCALPVESSAALGVDPDWVEAMAFAWLAKQTLAGLPGNLPEVTGAQRAVILGEMFPP